MLVGARVLEINAQRLTRTGFNPYKGNGYWSGHYWPVNRRRGGRHFSPPAGPR